jgi:peptidoglycan hydrolase-like protein with peptidoglycan-binding domain
MNPEGGTASRLNRFLGCAVLVAVGGGLSIAAAPAAAASPGGLVAAVQVAAAANPTLRLGATGAAVTTLQQRLTALHYDVAGVDGGFGNNTLHAVYAFQKVQGLGVDGIVGPATWAKLAAPTVPKAKYTHTVAAVEVNLTKRVLYLTKNGAVTKIVDASPGAAATPTVTGNFSVLRRIDGWRESPLGLLWRPEYFYGGYAIHGANSVPTYTASHGCVRVTIAAMNRLWTQLTIGQPVHVFK